MLQNITIITIIIVVVVIIITIIIIIIIIIIITTFILYKEIGFLKPYLQAIFVKRLFLPVSIHTQSV